MVVPLFHTVIKIAVEMAVPVHPNSSGYAHDAHTRLSYTQYTRSKRDEYSLRNTLTRLAARVSEVPYHIRSWYSES